MDDLWLPLAPDYKEKNVSRELEDPRSFLNFYRKLIATRKASPALVVGDYCSLTTSPAETMDNCFVYERQAEGQRMIVALNFSGQEQKLSLAGLGKGRVILSTMMDREDEVNLSNFTLRANEGCIIAL